MLREIYNACSSYVHAPLDAFDKGKSDPERSAALKKFASFILVAPLVVAGLVTLVGRACIGISDALSKKVDEVAINTPPLSNAQGVGAKPTFLQAQHNAIKESILTSKYSKIEDLPKAGEEKFFKNSSVEKFCNSYRSTMEDTYNKWEKARNAYHNTYSTKEGQLRAVISTYINIEKLYRTNCDLVIEFGIPLAEKKLPPLNQEPDDEVETSYRNAIEAVKDKMNKASESYFQFLDASTDKEKLKTACLESIKQSEAAFQDFLPQLESFIAQRTLFSNEIEEIQRVINDNITETWIRKKELGAN